MDSSGGEGGGEEGRWRPRGEVDDDNDDDDNDGDDNDDNDNNGGPSP